MREYYAVMRSDERERFMRNLASLRFALTATDVGAATLISWAIGSRRSEYTE
jgi:hypothetical protein